MALRNVEALLPFTAWQIIFVIGIFFGCYYPKIVEWYRSISETKRRHIYKTITSATGITFSVSLVCFTLIPHLGELFPAIQGSFLWNITEYVRVPITPYIDKNTLDPLRLAVAIGWFVGIYMFIRHHEKVINKYSRRFFELFGKNSLYVYGWHTFILFLIEIYIKPTGGSTNIWLSTLVAILVLSVIYLFTKYRHILVRKKKQLIGALSVNEVS